MIATTNNEHALIDISDLTGGDIYGEIVEVSYGGIGELEISIDGIVRTQSGPRIGLRIGGHLDRRSGYHHAELRKLLNTAGYYAR